MSLPALPPMRVPTLTEVLDWPPAELVVEHPAMARSDSPAEGELATCTEDAVEPATAAPLLESPSEPANEPAPMLVDEAWVGDRPAEQAVPTLPFDETVLTQRLLLDLQRHVDTLLEQQIRASMQPLLNRLADTLALQAREELASAVRDMVALAVSREMIRLRAAEPRSDSTEP